jgi:hypothetical protein
MASATRVDRARAIESGASMVNVLCKRGVETCLQARIFAVRH